MEAHEINKLLIRFSSLKNGMGDEISSIDNIYLTVHGFNPMYVNIGKLRGRIFLTSTRPVHCALNPYQSQCVPVRKKK